MTQKFCLTSERKEIHGRNLYRIKALMTFSDVKIGDLGGWVEREDNLSQDGLCWVYDQACVNHMARISKNAQVRDQAHVGDHAIITDNSTVREKAIVGGYAVTMDNSNVSGRAIITGDVSVHGYAVVTGGAMLEGSDTIPTNAFIDRYYYQHKKLPSLLGIGSKDELVISVGGSTNTLPQLELQQLNEETLKQVKESLPCFVAIGNWQNEKFEVVLVTQLKIKKNEMICIEKEGRRTAGYLPTQITRFLGTPTITFPDVKELN